MNSSPASIVRVASGCAVLLAALLAVGGCAGVGTPEVVTEAPGNWQVYENRSVTLQGNAANSPSGPFLRLKDNARLSIIGIPGWGIDYVGRPIGVEGTVVKGTDAFADRYVLKLAKYYRVQTDQQPISITPPEPDPQDLPTGRKKPAKKP